MSRPQAVVGMSGGIDSSVAAAMLLRDGFPVVGVTMRTYSGPEPDAGIESGTARHGCYGPGEDEEIRAAQAIAARLGIEHRVLDLTAEYRRAVLDYFRDEYLNGRTPNPCVRCNRTIKFGALLHKARSSGIDFEYFATGHYVRLARAGRNGRHQLRKGRDPAKDQSYFLSALTQEQLAECLFPLGELTKGEVKQLARELDLGVADRAESQDFAAIGYATFVCSTPHPGPIRDRAGRILGQHEGIHRFTIGQRRGLGVSAAHPLYVTAIDAASNTVTVGPQDEVLGRAFTADHLNWVSIPPPTNPLELAARIRYRHAEAPAQITPLEGGRVAVVFREPQLAITPGQAVVFYDGDLLAAGGIINSADPL